MNIETTWIDRIGIRFAASRTTLPGPRAVPSCAGKSVFRATARRRHRHGDTGTETPAPAGDVARIEAPVQGLQGAFDTSVPLTNLQRLADLLPNSRFARIPGTAHHAWKDTDPDRLDEVPSRIDGEDASASPAAQVSGA